MKPKSSVGLVWPNSALPPHKHWIYELTAVFIASCDSKNPRAVPCSPDYRHCHFQEVGPCVSSVNSRPWRVRPKLRRCRSVYYQYRWLFREQRVVDDLVDDLAFTLGFGRDALNIVWLIPVQAAILSGANGP